MHWLCARHGDDRFNISRREHIFNGLFLVGSTLSNPAIPGDITASFVLEGIGIGTGAFLSVPAAGGTDEAAFRIDSAIVNPIPLPAALPLFAAGLGIVTFLARRKKTAAVSLRRTPPGA